MFFKLKNYYYFIFLITGFLLSIYSSMNVLNLNSSFWLNDEGRFMLWAIGNKDFFAYNTLDGEIGEGKNLKTFLRYKLFVSVLKFYFIILNEPIYIVILHKFLVVFIFVFCFSKYIVNNYGIIICTIIYLPLLYLNLFLLRETLLFLSGLSLLILNNTLENPKNYIIKKFNNFIKLINNFIFRLFIFFMRPQSIFVYLDPKNSINLFLILFLNYWLMHFLNSNPDFLFPRKLILMNLVILSLITSIFYFLIFVFINIKLKIKVVSSIIYFLIISMYIYNVEHFKNFLLSWYNTEIFSISKENFITTFFSLYSLNPFTKIIFYISNSLFIELILIFFAGIISIFFLIQILLSLFIKEFYFRFNIQLFVGIIIIFLLYGILSIQMDFRVFLSIIAPFFLYFNLKIVTKKVISFLLMFLSIPFLYKIINLSS